MSDQPPGDGSHRHSDRGHGHHHSDRGHGHHHSDREHGHHHSDRGHGHHHSDRGHGHHHQHRGHHRRRGRDEGDADGQRHGQHGQHHLHTGHHHEPQDSHRRDGHDPSRDSTDQPHDRTHQQHDLHLDHTRGHDHSHHQQQQHRLHHGKHAQQEAHYEQSGGTHSSEPHSSHAYESQNGRHHQHIHPHGHHHSHSQPARQHHNQQQHISHSVKHTAPVQAQPNGRHGARVGVPNGTPGRHRAGRGPQPTTEIPLQTPVHQNKPREGVVELAQLHVTENEQTEWRQKGRWIKFEEEVNEDVGRWGKPQVSSLSFHSLLELRRCIEKGTVLLDLPAPDLGNIATCVVDNLMTTGQLERTQRNSVLNALLQRHVHQSELARLHQPLSRVSSLFQRSRITPSGSFQSFTSVPLSRTGSSRFSVRSLAKNRLTPLHNRLKRSRTTDTPATVQQAAGASQRPDVVQNQSKESLITPDYTWSGREQIRQGGADIVENRAATSGYVCDCGDPNCTIGREPAPPLAPPQIEITVDGTDTPTVPQVLTREEQELLNKIPADAEATTVLVGNVDFLTSPVMAFVRLTEGRLLGNLTEVPIPVRFLFILLGPEESGDKYHEIGRAIATLMADTTFHEAAYRAESRQDLLTAIEDFLEDSLVLPRGKYDKDLLLPAIKRQQRKRRKKELALQAAAKADQPEEDDPLAKTGRLFGGLVEDIKRLKKRYISDFQDGMNSQTIITTIFMYFGCIAPTIAFGSLLGEKTKHAMGLPEMIFSTALGGVIFGMLSGQPMMLIGPTGPTVVFEGVIYQFCKENGLDFFSFRLWCGLWVFAILMLIVITDSSYLVKKFTRFTEEVFAALIAFLFIFEPLLSIANAFEDHPVDLDYCTSDTCLGKDSNLTMEPISLYGCVGNATGGNCSAGGASNDYVKQKVKNQPNTAMLYMVLLIGTFVLAYALRMLKSSRYLGKKGRRFLGDFGILVSILVFVFIDHVMFGSIYSQMIDAPSGITTSKPRSWLVDPMEKMNPAVIFGSGIAGLLVAFLVFVETQVTCLICCSPDHKFNKTGGYHLNLTVVSFYILLCSFIGLPWTCGTPVPSLSHTQNLLKINKNVAPGMKPIIEGAHEQRISNTFIHLLIGLSLTPPITFLLQQIPFAVIMGVFLYLGFCNILTLQFTQRCILMLIPPKHHPEDMPYVRHVRSLRMHMYTGIQIFWWGVLITFKMTKAGLVFPLMVGLMVPLRDYIVGRIFTEKELHALDPHGSADHEDADSVDVDEYETHVRL